jgi:Virulence-associated protein E
MLQLNAKAGTQNIDRILRLPGTINLPNAKKKREGRVVCPTKLINFNDVSHSLDAFPSLTETAGQQKAKHRHRSGVEARLDHLDSLPEIDIADLPISNEIKAAIDTDGGEIGGGDRSKGAARIACELVRANCTDQQIASVLWHQPISAHFREQADPARAIQRVISWARAESEDFSLDNKSLPSNSSQHNIRLALRRLGVYVTHDVFQDRLLIKGLPECGPLLDDRAMERLWLTIDEEYRFRPVKDFFWTVVGDEARRHGFHPVVDYLAGLHWDGSPRIDKWLSTYGGAEATSYTDAVGALMLIAAVRRVRQPGCKFDEMVVLESEQGTDKSSALRLLAVNDDWFHDDVPLNADGKRVIEALSGRWIVEAAELNGMRKGEVEHLKAFLSRTHDRARMSYDRYPTEGKRQCIIVGTTNSGSYLRDSTGNRRFWPVAIKQFDTKALRRDRDQLWAEAAAREAQGASIRLDRSLWAAAGGEQALRRIADPWEEIVAENLDDKEGKLSVEDAWKIVGVGEAHRTQEHNRRLGDAMKKAGWSHGRRRRDGRLCYAYVKGESDRWLRATRIQPDHLYVRYEDENGDTAFKHAAGEGSADTFFR